MNWDMYCKDISFDKKDQHNNIEQYKKHYDDNTISIIQGIYVAAVFLWIVAIFVLDLLEHDILVWFFVAIPIIIFAINFRNVENMTNDLEDQMFRGNLLSFGFVITVILLNWKIPIEHNKYKFFRLIVVAFILLMFSLLDVWVEEEKLSIVKHIKTILHTSALILLTLALYLYYTSYQEKSLQ